MIIRFLAYAIIRLLVCVIICLPVSALFIKTEIKCVCILKKAHCNVYNGYLIHHGCADVVSINFLVCNCLLNDWYLNLSLWFADVSPPTIVIPCPVSPVIQFIGPMDVNAMVMWTEPVALDDIPGPVIATVSPDTNIFTEGVTSVIYTFTDQAGNQVSCGFEVSVMGQ